MIASSQLHKSFVKEKSLSKELLHAKYVMCDACDICECEVYDEYVNYV